MKNTMKCKTVKKRLKQSVVNLKTFTILCPRTFKTMSSSFGIGLIIESIISALNGRIILVTH